MSASDGPVARLLAVVLDCTDLDVSSRFWRDILGYVEVQRDPVWVSLADPADNTRRLSLQLNADHVPPTWPDPATPQQLHLDLRVAELAVAAARARRAGATILADVTEDDNEIFQVFADPAGHPFCLIEDKT